MSDKTKPEIDPYADWEIKNWRAWGSWFSWGSPVGLGLFILMVAGAAWVISQI